MYVVFVDVLSVEFVDGVFCCVSRVGGAYDLVVVCDGVFIFEGYENYRRVGYELDQFVKEGVFAVDSVEVFGFCF